MKKVNKFGLNLNVIKKISAIKNEPKWMLDIRLKAYNSFKKINAPKWGPNLSKIDFNKIIYYSSPLNKNEYKKTWNDVPKNIRSIYKKLNIQKNEAKYFAGLNSQFDSEIVYNNLKNELNKKGVIFTNIETAIQKYPNLVKRYFSTLIPYTDNKYAALNTAVWSGGSFVYVPKKTKLDQPLQAYFRINKKSLGQFERTLIIVDEGAYLHYNEGCTAPVYDENNLHASVVEIFVNKKGYCRYSTIQNWSDNVINLVTKRAITEESAVMEWIDGNLGSKLNMKYPCTILKGNNSVSKCISIALASKKNIIHDTGAKMIHIGKNTKSQIISKSIAQNGGNATYRGLVKITRNSLNSSANVVCDTLILDDKSKSDTFPTEKIMNNSSVIKHEAKITDLDKQMLFYLASKGIDTITAKQIIITGFTKEFNNELPIEYSVELNRLMKLNIR